MICNLCNAADAKETYKIEPTSPNFNSEIEICPQCKEAIESPAKHCEYLRFLTESIWNENSSVKVLSYKLLNELKDNSWAQDALDIAYLEESELEWANALLESGASEDVVTRDSNGTKLEAGDSVTIIKDLQVKGAGFTAKRGSVVKNIHLTSTAGEIEGRVNGVKIVLLSKFLKKA